MLHGNKINRSCSEYIWKMIHFGSLEKSSVFFCLKMEVVLQF